REHAAGRGASAAGTVAGAVHPDLPGTVVRSGHAADHREQLPVNAYAWLPDFITRLRNAFVFVAEDVELSQVGDARMLELEHEDWGRAGQEAAAAGLRWAGGWGEQTDGEFLVNACLMHG